ncbi:MAG TPA: MFS transporter, partial [Microbacterium sp.]|uniref:MFS transporter n=1 Tax=Microbacterium sp. TaxID=51671 RepID=UPI002B46FB71
VRRRARFALRGLAGSGLGRPLVPIVLFECGNLATTLLILRATDALGVLGFAGAASIAVLLYAGHNAVAAAVAAIAGAWIDRGDPRTVFATGAAVYLVGYALLALATPPVPVLVVAFVLAGAGIGFAETAESAMVAGILPDALRGSGFGVLGAVQAGGDVVATVVAGVLYTVAGPTAAFGYAAGWMLLAVAATILVRRRRAVG